MSSNHKSATECICCSICQITQAHNPITTDAAIKRKCYVCGNPLNSEVIFSGDGVKCRAYCKTMNKDLVDIKINISDDQNRWGRFVDEETTSSDSE